MSEKPAIILSNYITCRQGCTLRYLEALALNGFVKKFEVIDCPKKRFRKIIVYLIDDSKVESQCFFDEEVALSVRIIAGYIGLYRNRKIEEELRILEKEPSSLEK